MKKIKQILTLVLIAFMFVAFGCSPATDSGKDNGSGSGTDTGTGTGTGTTTKTPEEKAADEAIKGANVEITDDVLAETDFSGVWEYIYYNEVKDLNGVSKGFTSEVSTLLINKTVDGYEMMYKLGSDYKFNFADDVNFYELTEEDIKNDIQKRKNEYSAILSDAKFSETVNDKIYEFGVTGKYKGNLAYSINLKKINTNADKTIIAYEVKGDSKRDGKKIGTYNMKRAYIKKGVLTEEEAAELANAIHVPDYNAISEKAEATKGKINELVKSATKEIGDLTGVNFKGTWKVMSYGETSSGDMSISEYTVGVSTKIDDRYEVSKKGTQYKEVRFIKIPEGKDIGEVQADCNKMIQDIANELYEYDDVSVSYIMSKKIAISISYKFINDESINFDNVFGSGGYKTNDDKTVFVCVTTDSNTGDTIKTVYQKID